MVAAAYGFSVNFGEMFPEILGGHAAWRYTLISGLIPAIPLIIIRPFLPESPMWKKKKEAGTLQRPSIAELFQPRLRRTTVVTTILAACSFGAAFGAIQHVPRIVPGFFEDQSATQQETVVSVVSGVQEIGGALGRVLLAVLVGMFLARRRLLRSFQICGLLVFPFVFFFLASTNVWFLGAGVFLAALVTVAQFSFWGNYLPRVYPTRLRGTGESFAANIGGRMLGTFAAYITATLSNYTPGETHYVQLAIAAGIVGTSVYAIGIVVSHWLPEPGEADLPD